MMMSGSYVFKKEEEQEQEGDQFFDSREEISSVSDLSCPDSPKESSTDPATDDPLYEVWISNPESVLERRARFMRWMGLGAPHEETVAVDPDVVRMTSEGGAVLRSSLSASSSATSTWSGDTSAFEEISEFRIKNLDDGSVFILEQFSQDGTLIGLREVGSNRSLTFDEFNRSFGPSRVVERHMRRRDDNSKSSNSSNSSDLDKAGRSRRIGWGRSRRIGWLRRLGNVACVVDRQEDDIDVSMSDSDKSVSLRAQRVKVRLSKKRSKEFSAVYTDQNISAHSGAILTMKFSPDGEFLASGGEDGVVRVWRVMKCERRDEGDIPEDDPSCIYFRVNHNLELAPLYPDKEKAKIRSMRRTTDSACVVVPPEVFKISEQPIHEFYGHVGDVLDLSWSKDKYLLSSSVDKTVRLWKVGCDSCLKVFAHNNYVTCVHFNPINENYFVSGSVDGKIRIWEVSQRCVVDWTDIRDIVTAVCYHPEGKGIVVGCMTGDCRFYDVSDNILQLEVQVSSQGKKKSADKRITGFQYCPNDDGKLMVTSGDSQIRILDGIDIVSKYKGLHNAGSQISASFTSDGRHIIAASEDSSVYVWTHDGNGSCSSSHVKSIRSCEKFVSNHASVAIPWPGSLSRTSASEVRQERSSDSLRNSTIYLSPAGSFTRSHNIFSDFLPRGSATWPEEKLPSSSPATAATLCRSQYKFLKTSCRNSSHAWGLVIVTAGWDGRIRSFQNYGLPINH